MAQRSRFFDSKSSADVKSVYDYFVAYEVKLALLLTEYWHAKPETYSPTTVAASLAAVEANVNAQAGSLKPPVPDRTVADKRTGLMWAQALNAPAAADLHAIAEIYKPSRGPQHFRLKPSAGPTAVAGLPFVWRLPTIGEFERLIEGWSGRNPSAWLQDQAHMSKAMLDITDNQMWARDGFRLLRGTWDRLDIDVFDLDRGRSIGRPSPTWFFADGWRGDFSDAKAGLMYVLGPIQAESYWWGN